MSCRLPFLCLCLSMVSISPIRGQEKEDGERLVWKAFDPNDGKPFYQEIQTQTKQVLRVLDQTIPQTQDQLLLIRWTPQLPDAKGNSIVVQEILRVNMSLSVDKTKFIEYDTDKPQPTAGGGGETLQALVGVKTRFTITPQMQIEQVAEIDGLVRELEKKRPGTRHVLEAILSERAAKKLIEPTLAAFPTTPVKKGSSWRRNRTFDMDSLGAFVESYTFTHQGKRDGLDEIRIKSSIKLIPKVQVIQANLKDSGSRGFALFNRDRGWFERIESTTTLEGDLVLNIGGVNTTLNLRHHQEVRSRMLEKRPK